MMPQLMAAIKFIANILNSTESIKKIISTFKTKIESQRYKIFIMHVLNIVPWIQSMFLLMVTMSFLDEMFLKFLTGLIKQKKLELFILILLGMTRYKCVMESLDNIPSNKNNKIYIDSHLNSII